MNKEFLHSADFKKRLFEVYGSDDSQLQRFQSLAERLEKEFTKTEFRFFSAPGRTEVCGNHVDHNNGIVLAAAVDLDALACVAPTDSTLICVNSEGYEPLIVDFSNLSVADEEAGKSSALIRGTCARFKELGYRIGGFEAVVTSKVLSGSGLSSSAAYEVLIGTILNYLYNDGKISAVEIAQIAQYAENVYFKKPCGLMDQTACSVGGFVKIDFEDTSKPIIRKVDFDLKQKGCALCIVDTGGNHANLTDDYAAIRYEMNGVAEVFGKKVLREVDENLFFNNLKQVREKVGDRATERALHFYEEIKRVEAMEKALGKGDFDTFQSIILESGRSSYMYNQNCFTLSDPKEQPVALALCITDKVLKGNGAYRVHGGGFAGTIQAFVPFEKVSEYTSVMKSVFGENSCYLLNIRSHGGCEI